MDVTVEPQMKISFKDERVQYGNICVKVICIGSGGLEDVV